MSIISLEKSTNNVWHFTPISAFPDICEQWDTLNRNNHNSPLLDTTFITPLLEAFSTGKEIIGHYMVSGEVKALGIFNRISPFQVTTFQPNQAPVGLIVIDKTMDHDDLFLDLLKSFPGFVLNLGILFQDSHHYVNFPNTPYINSTLAFHTPSISIDTNFEKFWSGLSKSFRKQFNSRYNKLDNNNVKTTLNCVTEYDEIERAINTFGLIESSGWKGKTQTAIHPENIQGKLYKNIFENFARKGEVCIFEYLYDNEVVAVDLCLLRNNILLIMKTTYDEDHKDTSPTQLMRKEYLEQFYETQNVKVVESYGHIKNWHQQVAQNIRPMFITNIYRWPLLKLLHGYRLPKSLIAKPHYVEYELTHVKSICALSAKLKKSLSQQAAHNFFSGYDWFELLEKHALNPDQEIRIYVLEDSFNNDPLLIYPLLIDRSKSLLGEKTTVTDFSTIYGIEFSPIFFQHDIERQEVLEVFFGKLKGVLAWDIININLLHDSENQKESIFRLHQDIFREEFLLSDHYAHSINWTINLETKNYGEYLEERPQKLKNTLRRKKNKLAKEKVPQTIIYTNKDLDKAIEDYETIYKLSWKEKEIKPAFIRNLIQTAAKSNRLRLGILYIEEIPSASVMMINYDKVSLIYKLAYDPSFNSYSPGSLLLNEMIQHVMEKDHITKIDFGIGDDAYKRDWMDASSSVRGIVAFNEKSLIGLLGAVKHFIGKYLKRYNK